MESPEDDAGIATSASRRESAREKDIGQTEEVDATSSCDQDSTEARTSCQTPAMSEDNFDGDSVPSPSTQDVNTSTEAILDMIDEIVDGPGAPKRLPLVSESVNIQQDQSSSTSESPPNELTKAISKSSPLSFQMEISVASENSKEVCSIKTETQAECLPFSVSTDTLNISSENLYQAKVSEPECTKTLQNLQSEPYYSVSCVETETSTTYSNVPLKSALQTVENISESSVCEKYERTVKCVTSSEIRDCVTVEKAESTSSESSVSKGQASVLEKTTISPLRRRLVRPLPIDRRPDSTVSSTVDSQSANVFSTVQISENITKDVSSSSDAMHVVDGSFKADEIRNVSEISICKAETSVSTPKKIKLIRAKTMIPESNNDSTIGNQVLTSEIQQCESTSTDILNSYKSNPIEQSSSSIISTSDNFVLELKSVIKVSEQHLQEQVSNKANKQHEAVNLNLSVPETSSLVKENIDTCKSDLRGNSNLSKITTESSPISVESDNNQIEHCSKEKINESKVTNFKLTDSNSKISDTIMNIDNTNETNALLLDIVVMNKEIQIDPCISSSMPLICDKNLIIEDNTNQDVALQNLEETLQGDKKTVPLIKLNVSNLPEPSTSAICTAEKIDNNECETVKQVPKLTIKITNMLSEEVKSPTPKLTIKPLKPPRDDERSNKIESNPIPSVAKLNIKPILKPPDRHEEIPSSVHTDNTNTVIEQMPCVFKLNIKPIQKPKDNLKLTPLRSDTDDEGNSTSNINAHIPSITKINIKPILKPPEKINDYHRKSSSSEISESEYSENDETSTSTSDQASVSDQGSTDVVPKVTIKLGKPGTESEGKFYTQQNIPKLTIKGLQSSENEDHESTSKLKLVISQQDNKQLEKIPKLTIKNFTKSENQQLSPKLSIKPIRPSEIVIKDSELIKSKSCAESICGNSEIKENVHVPKITIKSVSKSDVDLLSRTPKKSTVISESIDHIPFVTKLNIKPILKPMDSEEILDKVEDKVPVVSKLNIKPIIRPKDNEIDCSLEDVRRITKLNIKPIKCPEVNCSEQKDCDGLKTDIDKSSIPVVTKINIRPIVKPGEAISKYSEHPSSETSNSSDDNGDLIPVVTKINIKPISKPTDESASQTVSQEQTITNITKLNIKPLIKPDNVSSPPSPKKDHLKNTELRGSCIPIVTKLNIKPIIKPEETETKKSSDEPEEKHIKKPPLVMKINIKAVSETINKDDLFQGDHKYNNLDECAGDNNYSKMNKSSEYAELSNTAAQSINPSTCQEKNASSKTDGTIKQNCITSNLGHHNTDKSISILEMETSAADDKEVNSSVSNKVSSHRLKKSDTLQIIEKYEDKSHQKKDSNIINVQNPELLETQCTNKPKVSLQNCTLLKKLLENTKDHLVRKVEESRLNISNCLLNQETNISNKDMNCTITFPSSESKVFTVTDTNIEKSRASEDISITSSGIINDVSSRSMPTTIHNICEIENSDNLTKPLEINISEKLSNQSSGADSPRIILKINKTDHGPSAKIITEETKRPDTPQQCYSENIQENLNNSESLKNHNLNSRRKLKSEDSISIAVGKRLRSSRIIENVDKSPHVRRNMCKRPSTTETSPTQNKESELSILESKRLKLGQLLSVNKSLTLAPVVTRITQTSPTKTSIEHKLAVKPINHSILNNEYCSKNGNSKLHNILSNLQAKQKQSLSFQDTNHVEVTSITSENRTDSTLSDSISEIIPNENSHNVVQEMLINENADFRDLAAIRDDISKDPLEVDNLKEVSLISHEPITIPQHVELTPQPKKRGRPRKIPLTDSPKPVAIVLPIPALEERPQRSLRLTRGRPAILRKPRGRGRGRGSRGAASPLIKSYLSPSGTLNDSDSQMTPIDPTCSRIKLPRMTEALDNMPGSCSTPLSSRRRSSTNTYLDGELKSEADSTMLEDAFLKLPEILAVRGRGGRGSRGGRGRTPRGRGRGRGGGRGAVYMKETMGIYGRVCGPATTTVQLFEEETCMMDDNATPAKPSHLMDEDSQSSVKSLTNESNKFKKSKFADLFDSNKVWTAADVKEYTWPSHEKPDAVPQITMIQEQVAMFLGVKSFKRRYPELKRRPIVGEEKDYVLAKGLVIEALCDLGITAVDASDVLDIMLSDYPHKYEEYRSHQRERQLTEPVEETKVEIKTEERSLRVEAKVEKYLDVKPDVPKIDPEKVRQDTAAAAIASASEWNARMNALRHTACVDLQTLTIHRRRAPVQAPRIHMRPPGGFYPHALLPGQYQHAYRVYTPEQLRYFPLNTVLAAPPAPPSPADSSSDSEPDWGSRYSSSEESDSHIHASKRKKLSKVKRSSQTESKEKEEGSMEISVEETCRTCKLRLEGNRKYTHERFLVCASCNAKLHPSCVELGADTIRKCREYAWQCAECKTCCSCRLPADDDKMLFCDLCDRGFHIYCVGLSAVPNGRWHCVECAICKSCGARDPAGLGASCATPTTSSATPSTSSTTPTISSTTPGTSAAADWHHQTRRGPGGHKVYSHSLCTPCARAYRIGRYCPLCERSFIGPKGTMQLVICKLCDRQLHQECVRQTVSSLKVMDYTCAECRRGGITSRAAAVRLAPRTIATLFMAKRRFNKYAHRQYMQSRMASADASDSADTSLDCAG